MEDCALCTAFHNNWCNGCPIYEANPNNESCKRTPYEEADRILDLFFSEDWHKEFNSADELIAAWKAAAKAEREFLESLLP
jgi:hypothetical protein